MSASRVLLAGATGNVGRALLPLLRDGGYRVRTLSRDRTRARALSASADEIVVADATDVAALVGVTSGVDIVVSCLGASVDLSVDDRRTFAQVDTVANANLLSRAVAASVRRFVYVGAYTEPGYAATRYIQAHETFIRSLRASGMPSAVVRPTGMFPSFRALLPMAARGRIVVIGDGLARTNPVDPADVARACFDAVSGGPDDVPIGGPDVFTRAEIARIAFSAAGVPARLTHLAPWVFRSSGRAVRLLHPRLGEVLEFASKVSVVDAIAPKLGTSRLEDYLHLHHTTRENRATPARLGAPRKA